MGALAWLLIPLFAAVGAALWGKWATRQRTAGDGAELAGYARFREAMEKESADSETPSDAAGAAAPGGAA
ncbi:hypothetical protein ACIPW9_07325 [Streptomyces sp. NPDC090052]|uniref:hypothetical protein n=1 Tax=unclassified Streptomyces TaxID=2593676 RepID=UPI0022565385|nr:MULTISPECIES: hypothetical protein [unclassified Streptomyces]MCX4723901.1 hypothetical protein [Streptomyces sp. NBC_01306]WSV06549.1 hypothetical protein OG372_24880 [Streptomyces sp. NBC_01020]WSX44670.1 hypothetical protein OG760_24865 [Streptomyces sp. NBC_00963]WSX67317.1 hypothetical protein OG221_12255 [Streptomyces sp. NBC_00932]